MAKDPTAFKQRFEAYKNGKSVKEIYDAGYIKEPVITPDPQYNEYINSLPDNQRLTPESQYRSHRYWELNDKPKNFGEAIGRGMFTYDFTDNGWHANSVALNNKTGEYEFMKPNWHNTKVYEDAWYYSKDGADFRSKYTKKPGVAYDKYIPRFKNGKDTIPAHQQFVEDMGPILYKEMVRQGVNNIDSAYRNMITQLAYESNYGQSRVARQQNNFGGVGWNGKTYTSYKNKEDFAKAYVSLMNSRYKNIIGADSLSDYAKGLKSLGYYEDTLENYTRNLTGMKSLHNAVKTHRANNPTLYTTEQPVYQEPIVNYSVKPVSTAVRPIIPAEQTIARWAGAENQSPYITGRPLPRLQPSIKIPTIREAVEAAIWKPEFKDGKLPKHGDGTESYPEVAINAAKSAIDFVNKYYNSPGFNERFRRVTSDSNNFLNSQYNPTASYWKDDGWENTSKMSWQIKRTPLKIGKINPVPEPNAYYNYETGDILWGDNSTPTVVGMNWNTIMAHELGHALDKAIKVSNKSIGPRLHEDAGEHGFTYSNLHPILRKSKPYQYIRNTMDRRDAKEYDRYPNTYVGGFNMGEISHDARPEENYADLFAVRKLLYDQGIFDSTKSGQVFTKKHLDAFKKNNKSRLLDNFSDDDVIWMINNVASTNNKKDSDLLYAANGKSPIHIKPANRGKFTALKKRTGHSASWFKKNGTPAQKKMATFALNAKKWSH